MIFDAISCGGSSRYRRDLREDDDEDKTYITKTTSDSKSATIGGDDLASSEGFVRKSEKLCDLLNISTKKKEETLEVLKRVVRDLQAESTAEGECGDDGGYWEKKIAAASEVRLLAKDDTEARVTLGMLGAIPPLVSMIDDSPVGDAQIASLYALLNLGIGNDAYVSVCSIDLPIFPLHVLVNQKLGIMISRLDFWNISQILIFP